jgi:hypothetical protein
VRDTVFLDTETTGLEDDSDIWEFAAIRRTSEGAEDRMLIQIFHDAHKAAGLPPEFQADHATRFDPGQALRQYDAARKIAAFLAPGPGNVAPQIVGAVPSFDTGLIARLLRRNISPVQPVPWYHRLRCVESITAGHLGHEIGGLQACLAALGLPTGDAAAAHTAMGDALSARAIWDAVIK